MPVLPATSICPKSAATSWSKTKRPAQGRASG
jgi:hypothetical protein